MFTTGWKPVPLTVLATGVQPVPLSNGEMRRVLLAEELLKCPARLVVRDPEGGLAPGLGRRMLFKNFSWTVREGIAAATPWVEWASCPFLMFTTGWKPVPLTVLATGVQPVPLYNFTTAKCAESCWRKNC